MKRANLAVRSIAFFCLVSFAGCATSHQARSVTKSGFLWDYSQLKPGDSDQALLSYRNPKARWTQYKKVIIDPVSIYAAPDADMKSESREQRMALANYFTSALKENLSKHFTVVRSPAPGTLRIRAALTDADQSEVLINTISTVMPIGLALSTAKRVVTGSDTGVGFAQAEVEILDSDTTDRLAAAVDKRYGTKALRSKFGSWNDAQAAMDAWAGQIAERLVEVGAGKQ